MYGHGLTSVKLRLFLSIANQKKKETPRLAANQQPRHELEPATGYIVLQWCLDSEFNTSKTWKQVSWGIKSFAVNKI
jgi:hypothetical protein